MALDPNRWTLKTQEAFTAALEQAKANSNPEVTPDHLLSALLGQDDGVVLPDPAEASASQPLMLRNRADEAVAELPEGLRRRVAPRPRAQPGPRARRRRAQASCTTSTCRPSTCCSPWPTGSSVSREDLLAALREVRGSHRVTSQNPEEQYQALEKYGRDLTEVGAPGQARPGHRPRRRDPSRHPGAVAPHQEQPRAHRRARRRQDRDRRGPGPSHRRGRRARGLEEQAPRRARPRLDGRGREVPRRVRGAAEGRAQGDHRRRGRGHHVHRRDAHHRRAPARPRARWTRATCSSRCSPAASCA